MALLAITIVRSPKKIERQLQRNPLKIRIAKKEGLAKTTAKVDLWMIRMLRRANIKIEHTTVLLLIVCSGLIATAIAVVLELPAIIAIVIGVAVATGCFGVYYIRMLQRIRKFNKQFPAGLDLMARAARAGESIENALVVAQKSSEAPLSDELRYCQRQLELGMSIEEVSEGLADRIGSRELKLFAHTISIHRSIGGRLANSLERLSVVIRKRMECQEKLKSMTSLGRFAVISIIVMGALVLTYMVFMEPEYIGRLTESDLGKKLIMYASVSELVGLIWVGWTLNSDV